MPVLLPPGSEQTTRSHGSEQTTRSHGSEDGGWE